MTHENPLDFIKQLNAENEAKKIEELKNEELKKEQETLNQEEIDSEYLGLQIKKDESLDENNPLVLKIREIAAKKGLAEDKIREIQEEAEKHPATLKYFEENKNELLFSFYDELERLKTEQEDNELVEEIILRENDKKIENLYPKTTAGKEELMEELKDKVALLFDKVSQKMDGRDHEIFGMTFEEMEKKIDLFKIQDFLKDKNELNNLQENPVNNKWERKEFSNWQKSNLEKIESGKANLEIKYNDFLSQYLKDRNELLSYEFPNFQELTIVNFRESYIGTDFPEAFDEINTVSNRFSTDISDLDKKIREVENTFFKNGLKRLKQEKEQLKEKEQDFRDSNSWNKLVDFKNSFSKEFANFYIEINKDKRIPYNVQSELEGKKITEVFDILQEDKSFNQEEVTLMEKEELLGNKIKEFEQKVRA